VVESWLWADCESYRFHGRNTVYRHGRDASPRDTDQPALHQPRKRALHGALRARCLGDVAERHLRRRAAAAVREPPEEQIDEKRGRLPVVTDQVRHQRIEDVVIDGDVLTIWQRMP
jgi:hypothetical protein